MTLDIDTATQGRRQFILGTLMSTMSMQVAKADSRDLLTYLDKISPERAFKEAASGELILIDIRRPEEWVQTGSGQGAHRLDMRRNDFVSVLDTLVQADRTKPIAIICARGMRSARVSTALRRIGFSNIIDVPEGMLGSNAGPGWLERALPVDR